MPIPSVPSQLATILAAKTYNAAWFAGATIEAQITNAIAAAVLDGAIAVYIPANMFPYDTSLVTFNNNVQMVREGGDLDVCDVRAYGANNGGLLESRLGIQAAATAAIASGRKLYFPTGTYLVSRQSDGTALTFAGNNLQIELAQGATIKLNTTTSACHVVFLGDPTNTIQYSNIKMTGGKINGNASTDPKLIRVGWTKNVEIRSVECSNVGGAGSASTAGVSIAGKDSSNRTSEVLVADCYIHDLPGTLVCDGIIATLTNRTIIRNNRLVTTGRAVFLQGVNTGCVIEGNTGSGQTDNGIRLSAASGGTATADLKDHVIANNSINGAAVDGIRIDGSRVIVSGNTVASCAGRGIKADIAQDCVITGNVVSDCSNEGIFLAKAGLTENDGKHSRNSIANNIVRNNNGTGIRIQGGGFSGTDVAFGNIVQGNYVYGNAGGGLEFECNDNLQVIGNTLEENTNGASSGDKQGIYVDVDLGVTCDHGVMIRNNKAWDLRGAGNRQIRGCRILVTHASGVLKNVVIEDNDFTNCPTNGIQVPAATGTLDPVRIDRNQVANGGTPIIARSTDAGTGNIGAIGLKDVSGDRGDANVTIFATVNEPIQYFSTALTANRTCTITNTSNATVGTRFRIVRTGLGAFTLTVQDSTPTTIKVIPNATAAFVEAVWNGSNWVLAAYGTL